MNVHPLRSNDGARRLEEASPGAVIAGKYNVIRSIARGGMGSVVEAEHLITSARVAIKTLNSTALEVPAAHARLLREARILGQLRHPGLIAIYDAGDCPRHGPFAALELVDGRALDGVLLARQTLDIQQVLAIGLELASALAYVHRHGIVHRDVKPSNVLISRTPVGDRIELIDFGIAKLPGEAEGSDTPKLTKLGEVLGTVEYMSPEQLMGTAPVDGRSDVYAVGVLLYECLTGQLPRTGSATAMIAQMLTHAPIAPVRQLRRDVPAPLEAAIMRALTIDREQRQTSCAELGHELLAAAGGRGPVTDLLAVAEPAVDPHELRRKREEAKTVAGKTLGEARSGEAQSQRGRRYARAPYTSPVRIVLATGSVDGRCEDVSEGGLLVIADTECAVGQTVEVRLPLPGNGRVARVSAITRWARGAKSTRALGLELVNPPEEVRSAIRAYVALMSQEAPRGA